MKELKNKKAIDQSAVVDGMLWSSIQTLYDVSTKLLCSKSKCQRIEMVVIFSIYLKKSSQLLSKVITAVLSY